MASTSTQASREAIPAVILDSVPASSSLDGSIPTSGFYNYPPAEGFTLDVTGNPIKARFVLHPGVALDRFGSEFGFFVAPDAAPYMQRALPPPSLDAPQSNSEYVVIMTKHRRACTCPGIGLSGVSDLRTTTTFTW